MILINLLPPELRKTSRTGVNPVFIAAAAGILIVLGMVGLYAWINQVRIPAAEKELEAAKTAFDAEKTKADEVAKLEGQIKDFEALHASITGLITRKVFWARTIDDFANLLGQNDGNKWGMEGYDVCCTQFSVAPASGGAAARSKDKAAGETVTFNVRATFRIVGKEKDKFGDYARDFFATVERSRFWQANGFAGRPVDPFKTITASMKKELGLAVADLSLDWKRIKVIPPPSGQGVQR